jgi:hypothetical protein
MRAGFAQFTAFSQDAKDNKIFEQTKLTMPVLAVGGEKSFGSLQAIIMRHVATKVQEAVVMGSGHWLMEERPAVTVVLIRTFLEAESQKNAQKKIRPKPRYPLILAAKWRTRWNGEASSTGILVKVSQQLRPEFLSY